MPDTTGWADTQFPDRDPLRVPAAGDIVLPHERKRALVPVEAKGFPARRGTVAYVTVKPDAAPAVLLHRILGRRSTTIQFKTLDEWRVLCHGAEVIHIHNDPAVVYADDGPVYPPAATLAAAQEAS